MSDQQVPAAERAGWGFEPDHPEDVEIARAALHEMVTVLRDSVRAHDEVCLSSIADKESDCDCGATAYNARVAAAIGCALCGGLPDADIHQPGYVGARPHSFLLAVER
jgi:hypothetical protein